jgi:hypothetical protein
MTKTDLYDSCMAPEICACGPRARGGAPTGYDFRHNFSGKLSQGPKNGLERRVSQFYIVCDKNQLLNKNIGKVMEILVLGYQKLGHGMHHRDLEMY